MSNPFFDHPILNSRGARPFFSQVVAVETAIWLTEVAPHSKSGKRMTKQWLDTCLQCNGGTYPAQLMYQELADIVLVDDGHGPDDLLHLIVEIKGYRREDAKEKKSTMETYWVPGVNNHKQYGRWAFAEFCDVYEIEADFKAKVESHFAEMIRRAAATPALAPSML